MTDTTNKDLRLIGIRRERIGRRERLAGIPDPKPYLRLMTAAGRQRVIELSNEQLRMLILEAAREIDVRDDEQTEGGKS